MVPIATPSTLRATLAEHGVAIVRGVLDKAACDKMKTQMYEFFEHVTSAWETPFKHSDEKTWRELYKLFPVHGMLFQHWGAGQSQVAWDVRQNPEVVKVFREFWKCEDLLTGKDGVGFGLMPEATNKGWHHKNWMHSDQSYTVEGFKCMQTWLTALDVEEGDSTLSLLLGSHKLHAEFAQIFGIKDKGNWYKLTAEQQQWYTNNGCELVNVTCKAGDMVCWDSRTIHCGKGPDKGRANPKERIIVYVSMQPRVMAKGSDLKKKRKAVEELRTTTHWAAKPKLFGKYPRTYGKPIPDTTPPPPPVLTELGRQLAGY
jgi:ectoine hydroxylase-related dioxygenase (phytanoyl-CoA dioxygenase family)